MVTPEQETRLARPAPTPTHPASLLKAARLQQGLPLRALSARIGMPYSTLSKLENGKMELTYDKLLRLSQGLGVDLGTLLAGEPVVETPSALGRRSVSRAGQAVGAMSDRHAHQYPAADLLGKAIVPIIIEVRVRSIEEVGGLVRHSGEEYLYVLEGAMELHSDLYAPLTLSKGDSVYFDSGMAHAYVRAGDTPCHVLSVCAGAGIQPYAQSAARGAGRAPHRDDVERPTLRVSDVET